VQTNFYDLTHLTNRLQSVYYELKTRNRHGLCLHDTEIVYWNAKIASKLILIGYGTQLVPVFFFK